MQREFKFRAWSTENNKMMDWEHIQSFRNFQKLLTIPFVKVMQYTGFKDKDGKEIYEGDILSCKVWIDGKWEDSKEPVMFKDGCFVLDWSFKKDGSYYEIMSVEIEGKKVLGNIYQNPELVNRAVGV